MKTILVTGAAGFIGFHLCEQLLKQDFNVIGVDNLNDYYDVQLKFDRLAQLGVSISSANQEGKHLSNKYPNFTLWVADISDKEQLIAIGNQKIDIICNLAAQTGVRYSLINPDIYLKSNINGFFNVLELAKNKKVDHLIYASSSSIYGRNEKVPFSEKDQVDHPVSLYAASKKTNELMAHTYSYLYGLPTTGLRFFTVYGPWGRPDMAYFLFTKAILEGKPINVFNHGKMRRDFTFVADIVQGIMNIIKKPVAKPDKVEGTNLFKSAPYKIYNIGNNNPDNLLYFIETLEKLLGKKAIKKMLPLQPGDVTTTFADIEALQKDFQFKPNTPLAEGLSQFVDWYLDYYVQKKIHASVSEVN